MRVIQGNPVNDAIAPYIEYLRKLSGATVNSLYRGEDAAAILHRHGKHTQAEIHRELPAISNPPGRSTHELRSDGVAYPGPVGRKLEWWQQGIDVNDADVGRMIEHARRQGWVLFQPYARGVEFHHLNFRRRPIHGPILGAKLALIRRRLPTQ